MPIHDTPEPRDDFPDFEKDLPVCDGCGEAMFEWYEVSYKLQTWRFCPDCCVKKEIQT